MDIKYHPGKGNVVAGALSRKPKGAIASLVTMDPYLSKELERLQIEMISPADQPYLATLQVTSSLVDKIKERQQGDPELMKII